MQLHTCDEFKKGIREDFFSFQGDFQKSIKYMGKLWINFVNLFQVFTTKFDLFTNYGHNTEHRNVLPDTEPLIGKCLDPALPDPNAGSRDAGSPDPVPDFETLHLTFHQ